MQAMLPINHDLYSIIDDKNNVVNIFYGLTRIQTIDLNDKTSLYINAVNLVECSMKQTEVAQAFGFDKSWLFRLMQVYRDSGYSGLINLKRGYPQKVTQELKDFVNQRFDYYYPTNGLKNFRDKIIDDVFDQYGIRISYETLRINLKQHKEDVKDKAIRLEAEEAPANGAGSIVGSEEIGIRDDVNEESSNNHNRYSGLLLLNSFIRELPLLTFFEKLSKKIERIKEIVILIIYMLFLSKLKIENYKELNHKELTEIIDVSKYKYPDEIRRDLREGLAFEDLVEINKLMFQYYIIEETSRQYWIFMDGHVIRYYGKEKIPKGYHQQSNCAVKGRVQYYMHSAEGKPLYFEINDFYNDFREIINKLIEELKRTIGEKYKTYLYVFDRGGYSYKEFKYLDEEKGVNFASWNKNDRTNYKRLDLDYTKVEIERKGNRVDKPKMITIEIALVDEEYKVANPENKDEYITVRRIVIKNGKKHSAVVTNDKSRSIEEIAEAMVFRWREEKGFEVEVKYRGLNDINSYKVEYFSEEVIKKLGYEENGIKYVDSEEYREYEKERKNVKRKISRLHQELGKIIRRMIRLEKVRNSKSVQNILEKINELDERKNEIEEKIKTSTQKIRKLSFLMEKNIKRLDYTQKFFMDIVRVACAHIDSNIMKVLSQYYKNGRDIYKMIDIIFATGGYVEKQSNGSLVVKLNKLNTKKENEVLDAFVGYVNNQNPALFSDESKRVFFQLK